MRIGSVTVGVMAVECRETMQVNNTRAIGVDGEHIASIGGTNAKVCRPIQGVSRQNQSAIRESSIAAGSEAVQDREGLRIEC